MRERERYLGNPMVQFGVLLTHFLSLYHSLFLGILCIFFFPAFERLGGNNITDTGVELLVKNLLGNTSVKNLLCVGRERERERERLWV